MQHWNTKCQKLSRPRAQQRPRITSTLTSMPGHISQLARPLFRAGGSLWPRAEREARSPGDQIVWHERARRFEAGDRFLIADEAWDINVGYGTADAGSC